LDICGQRRYSADLFKRIQHNNHGTEAEWVPSFALDTTERERSFPWHSIETKYPRKIQLTHFQPWRLNHYVVSKLREWNAEWRGFMPERG